MSNSLPECEHGIWTSTEQLPNVCVLKSAPVRDDRGSFLRLFCEDEFLPLSFQAAEVNLSYTAKKGTIRGLHLQPGLAKIVYVLQGYILDAVANPRTGTHVQVPLEASMGIYVPAAYAHGFQTLVNDVSLLYIYSDFYDPATEKGLHYTSFDLAWPEAVTQISLRDAAFERRHAQP